MTLQDPIYLQNQFLIAMPNLADPQFTDTVTYICDHSEEGAMGIVINHSMDILLGEILEQMGITVSEPSIKNQRIHYGGPVQRERGFILHRPGKEWHSSINLAEDIAITTSRDILESIAQGSGPKEAVVFLGYAGWEPGQLEEEIAENIWLSGPADSAVLFETPCHKRRDAAAKLIGVDLERLLSDAGHA